MNRIRLSGCLLLAALSAPACTEAPIRGEASGRTGRVIRELLAGRRGGLRMLDGRELAVEVRRRLVLAGAVQVHDGDLAIAAPLSRSFGNASVAYDLIIARNVLTHKRRDLILVDKLIDQSKTLRFRGDERPLGYASLRFGGA